MFWTKILKGGIALGVISFGLFFISSLANNYGIEISGFSFKIAEVLSAFGLAIAPGVIAIAIFFCRIPQK